MADAIGEPDLKIELLSQARYLAAIRAMIHHLAQRLGFDDMRSGQVSLAVDEALCNIINHGYQKRPDGPISIRIWIAESNDPLLRIVIEDRARQVDPATIRSRDLADIRPGGLGVYIIKEIMDEARYEHREGGGMRLTLLKRLPRDDSTPPHASSSHSKGDPNPSAAHASEEST